MTDLALDMRDAREMQSIVFDAARPLDPNEGIGARINRAYRRLQQAVPDRELKYWRVKAAWEGKAGCWVGRAHQDLRERNAKRQAREARANEDASQAVTTLRSLLETYTSTDPDFYREQILALEQVLRDQGCDVHEMGAGAGSETTETMTSRGGG